jgi:hypothetical protein
LFSLFSTGGKLVAGVVDTGPVSLTQVANLPLVSTTPAVLVAKFVAGVIDTCVVDTGSKFATGVVDTSGKHAAVVDDTGGAP